MRVIAFVNPIAGRGRAQAAATEVGAHLRRIGHHVEIVHSSAGSDQPGLQEALCEADVLAVIGGDGSIRQAAPYAIEAQVPVVQYPLGTENLFAREFGMKRSLDLLSTMIEQGRRCSVDVGVVNGRVFVLMVSLGFDAEVVHDLAARRRGAISHLSYLPPIARKVVRWSPPRVSIAVDDVDIVTDESGQVVVGNCCQYAFRFNPCAEAIMTDGLLDVVFMPMRSRFGVWATAFRCRTRRLLADPRVTFVRGKQVRIESNDAPRTQVDGDPEMIEDRMSETSAALTTPLDIGIRPAAMLVITPPV